MFVVGTAGHIDHGKSSLVLKMTGIDPDRLPEEKERGMTIDLGFAWAHLPSGRQIGIVDVPGHERFVKNMVAGVGGIDAVIFVIAADDGWMPQTEEHFQIIRLLGIKTGLVALTKKDLVDDEYLQLQTDIIKEKLEGSFLEHCAIVPLSTRTEEGIAEVLRALDTILTDEMQRPDIGAARLFIDRRFTIQGMGTVVTGTLLEGKLSVDEQVEIVPSEIKCRIRSLQTYKQIIDEATPGSRVAVNLAGVEKSAIDRGEALCAPGTMLPSSHIAAQMILLASSRFALRNGLEISFLLGTADVLGKIYLIETDALNPGQMAFVWVRLKSPVAAKIGDRFIIRRISPPDTIGGGVVLDTEFVGGRKDKARQVTILQQRLQMTPETIIRTELDRNIKAPLARLFQNSPFDRESVEKAIRKLSDDGELLISGDNVLSRKSLDKFIQPAMEIVANDHLSRPWSDGVEPGILAKKLKLSPEQLPIAVDYLVTSGKMVLERGFLKLAGHRPQLNADQLRLQGRLNAMLSASPLGAPTKKEFIDEDPKFEVVINFLRDRGDIVELKGGILMTSHDFQAITLKLVEYLQKSQKATASDIKSYLKTSRKYTIPILEKLDQLGITLRDGDYRTLSRQQ
jgi:selenocysteine-specific elongation factor